MGLYNIEYVRVCLSNIASFTRVSHIPFHFFHFHKYHNTFRMLKAPMGLWERTGVKQTLPKSKEVAPLFVHIRFESFGGLTLVVVSSTNTFL